MPRGQTIRISVGIAILIVVLAVYLPHFFYTYSTSAVVNANLVPVKIPIPGVLTTDLPQIGTEFQAGDVIGVIENERVDRSTIERLEKEHNSLLDRISAFKNEREKLVQLQDELKNSATHYKDSMIKRVEYDIAQAKQRQSELAAVLKQTTADLERKSDLKNKGFASNSAYDLSNSAYTQAKKALEQADINLEREMTELQDAKNDIYILNDGRREYPYQLQRYHEITIRLFDLEGKISENQQQLDEAQRNLELEKKRFEMLKRAEIKAPMYSAIWRRYLVKGSFIDANNPVVQLADCSNVFVEAVVHERFFEKIHVGDPVDVRFAANYFKSIPGRVMAVRGASTTIEAQGYESFASAPPVRQGYEIKVLIDIDQKDLPPVKSGFCHIGRNVEVAFTDSSGKFFSPGTHPFSYQRLLLLLIGVFIVLGVIRIIRPSFMFKSQTETTPGVTGKETKPKVVEKAKPKAKVKPKVKTKPKSKR